MRQLDHPTSDVISLPAVLAALSDPARLSIVCNLARGGECASTGFDLGLAGSTLSHHLKVLREAGVVQHRKDGTRCFVSLRADLDEVFPGLLGTVLRCAKAGAEASSGLAPDVSAQPVFEPADQE